MEKIDYKKLLNHRIFLFRYLVLIFLDLVFFGFLLEQDFILGKLMYASFILIPIYAISKLYDEAKEKEKRVLFYNDCVENMKVY